MRPRTSAHFLVGDALPATVDEVPSATLRTGIGAEAKAPMSTSDAIGVLQTQAPDEDGIPFVASHLRSLNYKQFRERQQYFVNALDALEFADKGDHSILQDFYAGSKIDPGWRTIAIEMTGFNFDNPETAPGAQQMANVLGVIWAVMKRYKISALDVLGHNELSLDKADPGKLFMATIRYLLGVKALIDADEEMKELVFGRFLKDGADEYIGADEDSCIGSVQDLRLRSGQASGMGYLSHIAVLHTAGRGCWMQLEGISSSCAITWCW